MHVDKSAIDSAIEHEDAEFAQAIKAVVTADVARLRELLTKNSDLVHMHSRSDHRATLLHYVAANAVEDTLQIDENTIYQRMKRCDASDRDSLATQAVAIPALLVEAGAEVDAVADAYGGGNLQTPLNWLVSSTHPNAAGIMSELTTQFCKLGAKVDGIDDDSSPLITAVGFGHVQAAAALSSQNPLVDNLLLAAIVGNLEKVESFQADGGFSAGNVSRCRTEWFQPSEDPKSIAELSLVFACLCGHRDVVEFLLSANVDKNAIPNGTHVTASPLHTACMHGQEAIVDLLIEVGADPTLEEPRYQSTAAGWARHGGNPRIIRKIGEYLPKFLRERELGNPEVKAFVDAVFSGNLLRVRAVLEKHALTSEQLNGPWFYFDMPAVVFSKKNLALVELLVENGADINQKSLWWAGGFGVLDETDEELANALMERGAQLDVWSAAGLDRLSKLQGFIAAKPELVHARGPDGKTPLHCAKSVSVAAFLISKGADLNAKCLDHESTPAQYLVADHPEVARYLIEKGCDGDIMLAAALGDIDLAEKLLASDEELIHAIVDGECFPSSAADCIYSWTLGWYATPHQVAFKHKQTAMVEFLMKGSDEVTRLINACLLGDETLAAELAEFGPKASDRQTRHVSFAARNNDARAVSMLLAAGLPVDATGQHRASALHWAAFHGNAAMVETVLRYEPNLGLRDADFNCTPIEWARQGCQAGWHKNTGDYPAVVRTLIDAGSPMNSDWSPTGVAAVDALFA